MHWRLQTRRPLRCKHTQWRVTIRRTWAGWTNSSLLGHFLAKRFLKASGRGVWGGEGGEEEEVLAGDDAGLSLPGYGRRSVQIAPTDLRRRSARAICTDLRMHGVVREVQTQHAIARLTSSTLDLREKVGWLIELDFSIVPAETHHPPPRDTWGSALPCCSRVTAVRGVSGAARVTRG